jgi:hypothetical protein
MLSDNENMKICVTGVRTGADPAVEYITNTDIAFLQELLELDMISSKTYNEYMKSHIK